MMEETADHAYSLGTAPVMDTLREIFTSPNPEYDTLFINLGTILRNCSSNKNVTDAKREDRLLGRKSTTPAHILIKEGKQEILKVTRDVCDLMASNERLMFPHVIVYFVNYRMCIPKEHYKPFTESEREMALAEASLAGIVHGARKDGTYSKVVFIEVPIKSRDCPHRVLMKELARIKSRHNVVMVSNHRLDYHLHKFCNKFTLVDSFTGNLVSPRELPKKVFGVESVPFLPITHAILGDKDDIKPSLKGKEKKLFIEAAERSNWITHSEEYVRLAIRNLKIPVPFTI